MLTIKRFFEIVNISGASVDMFFFYIPPSMSQTIDFTDKKIFKKYLTNSKKCDTIISQKGNHAITTRKEFFKMTKFTTYRIAVDWLRPSLIMCNNIGEIDESIYENARFDFADEDGNTVDIFQYFLTSLSESDVDWLESQFDLKFTYSNLLDCFVLCVDHFGTSWDYTACEVKGDFLEYQPEAEYTDSCNPPKLLETRKIEKGGN